jgi:hypothetical protein
MILVRGFEQRLDGVGRPRQRLDAHDSFQYDAKNSLGAFFSGLQSNMKGDIVQRGAGAQIFLTRFVSVSSKPGCTAVAPEPSVNSGR